MSTWVNNGPEFFPRDCRKTVRIPAAAMPQSHQIASPCKIGRTGSNPLAAPACALPASHRPLTKPQLLRLHHPRPHCKGPTTARTWP
eukprot:4479258-Prymnesium_polylepis.2